MICDAVMPFCSAWERDTHFAKHGHEFGARDAQEYEVMADAFLLGALPLDAQECLRRSRPDRIRLHSRNSTFGVSRIRPAPECVRTFYRVAGHLVTYYGGPLRYLQYECARIDP